MHKRRACHGARSAPWSAHSVVKHAQKSVCTNYEVPTGALDSRNARQLLDSLEKLNREENAAILMVTHDAYTASYSSRVLFIKDGRLFHELRRGKEDRKAFFEQIMNVTALMGGDLNYAV